MRPRVALRVLALTLASAVLPLSLAHATHSPTVEQVTAKAGQLGMTCTVGTTEVSCTGPEQYYFRSPGGVIQPATGPLQQVFTRVDAHSNGAHDFLIDDRVWMTELHSVGCADAAAVRKFIDTVAAQFEQSEVGGVYGPVAAGECSMKGELSIGQLRTCAYACWFITSNPLAGAFPTPTPVPTPSPTPPPVVTPPPAATASPAPSATPRPSASAAASATPQPGASASAGSSASATPTPSPTATASPTLTPRPSASATPEQTVAGITFAPEPSAAAPDVAEDAIPWAASVHGPADVSTDPAAVGASAAVAMLLLLFMGFVGELFNNTVKANYYELIGLWNKSWPGRLTAAWARLWRPRP